MDIFSYLLAKGKGGGGGSGTDVDWSAIGYDSPPQSIVDNYNYSLALKETWTSSTSLSNNTDLVYMPLVDTSTIENMGSKFYNCSNLVSVPLLDTSNSTNFYRTFYMCNKLVDIPLLDTSKGTSMGEMFFGCYDLKNIPVFDTSSVTAYGFYNTFLNCNSLTDESLNNILKMCINATSYTGTKKLSYMGLSSSYYSTSKIQSLSNYQDFIDAGWTIGY